MDMPLWARKCNECQVRGSCNHFAVIAEKGLCVVDGLTDLSLCVCVYIYVFVYMYIFIKSNMDIPLSASKCSECLVRGSCNHLHNCRQGPVHGRFIC
jgi:hypothetical protein